MTHPTDEQTAPPATDEPLTDEQAAPATEATDDTTETARDVQEPETFPREYVQRLRDENARYRQRAQRADDLAERLHVELVRATGRLADPTDLTYDESHLEDADALEHAIGDLLSRKPHLASRRPVGDVGQGHTDTSGTVDLAKLLRARA